MILSELVARLIDLEVEHGEEEVRVYQGPGYADSPVVAVERYDGPDGVAYVQIEAE